MAVPTEEALALQATTEQRQPAFFREDGYINMTKALKGFPGKRLDKFRWNDGTHDYIVALHKVLTNITYSGDWSDEEWQEARDALVLTKRGGRKGEAGTWCHPKIQPSFPLVCYP